MCEAESAVLYYDDAPMLKGLSKLCEAYEAIRVVSQSGKMFASMVQKSRVSTNKAMLMGRMGACRFFKSTSK